MLHSKRYPGVYFLYMQIYNNFKSVHIFKIGCSIDVGRRIRDGVYHTSFLPEDEPKYLSSLHPHGYNSLNEILFVEKLIHYHYDVKRLNKNRELFRDIDIKEVSEYLNSMGINHDIVTEKPKPLYNLLELQLEEYRYTSMEDIVEKNNMMTLFNMNKIELNNVNKIEPIKEDKVETTNKAMFNINFSAINIDNVIPSKIKPLSFQIEIIDKLYNYYINQKFDKGGIIIPCGMGKSYISLFLIEKMKCDLSVIFVPTIILSEQFEKISQEVLTGHVIVRFCGETNYKDNLTINQNVKTLIICTYDSAENLYMLCHKINKYPDINVYDEAHNTCVISKNIGEQSPYRNIIFLKSTYKLFMTATLKVIKSTIKEIKVEEINQRLDDEFGESLEISQNLSLDKNLNIKEEIEEIEEIEDVISMDNEQYYGKIIVNIDFSEAIDNGFISDYRFVIVNSGIPINIIKKTIKELNIQHMLTYHSSIEGALNLADELNSIGIRAFTINGNMNSNKRKEILEEFERTPNSVLTSCRVLSEGISLNHVDCIYFVDQRNSKINIIQSICRALRLHEDKTLATIIIEDDIKKYANILKNIVYLDKRLKTNYKKMFINIGFDKENIIKNNEEVNYIVRGRNEVHWEHRYLLALEYETIKGKLISHNLIYKDIEIGKWLSRQKPRYQGDVRCRKITDREYELLSQLNTIKHWKSSVNYGLSYDQKWMRNYKLSLEYEKLNQVEIEHLTVHSDNNICIGIWLSYQKKRYKDSLTDKSIYIDEEKYKLLFNLHSYKRWMDRRMYLDEDDKWMHNHSLCLNYEREHKTTIKTNDKDNYDFGIGEWIKRQKRRHKDKFPTPLNPTEYELMLQLNTFRDWLKTIDLDKPKLSKEDLWLYKYNLCMDFEAKNKRNIKTSDEHQEELIGKWFGRQKEYHKKDKINENRLNLLKNLNTFRDYLENN